MDCVLCMGAGCAVCDPVAAHAKMNRTKYDSGECCMRDHAAAQREIDNNPLVLHRPSWSCNCPCHTRTATEVLEGQREVYNMFETESLEETNIFPLTPDECHLFFSEMRTHTFSRHHPMFLYHASILARMRQFIENNAANLILCKDKDFNR